MKPVSYTKSIVIFTAVAIAQLSFMLYLTNGHFIFSLDDPYIHLALAENIFNGHYGINSGEVTAPSSSIIWPFLIAPLTALPYTEYWIVGLNFIFALLSFIIIFHFLKKHVFENEEKIFTRTWLPLAIFFVLIGNLLGLIFIGMEHSLQVLLAVVIIYGVMIERREHRFPLYLAIALIVIPLLRYESIALTAMLLLYFFIQGYRKQTLLCGFIISIIIIAFSVFLNSQGLHVVPNSVLAKSSSFNDSSIMISLMTNLIINVLQPLGWPLLALSIINIRCGFKKNYRFALALGAAGLLHLLAGKLWWYGRYDTYLLLVLSLSLVYIYKAKVVHWITHRQIKKLIPFALMLIPSLFVLLSTAYLSRAIYLQNFHFHQFATQIYQDTIVAHDIGLLSYKNEHDIVDVWGLASREALDYRRSTVDSGVWLDQLVKEKDAKLIFLTQGWFTSIPSNWIKIAQFSRNDLLMLPGIGVVNIYVSSAAEKAVVISSLNRFKEIIKPPATLSILE